MCTLEKQLQCILPSNSKRPVGRPGTYLESQCWFVVSRPFLFILFSMKLGEFLNEIDERIRAHIFSEFILEGSGGVAGNVPVYHLEKMYHVSNLFRPIQLVLVFTASKFTGKGLNL